MPKNGPRKKPIGSDWLCSSAIEWSPRKREHPVHLADQVGSILTLAPGSNPRRPPDPEKSSFISHARSISSVRKNQNSPSDLEKRPDRPSNAPAGLALGILGRLQGTAALKEGKLPSQLEKIGEKFRNVPLNGERTTNNKQHTADNVSQERGD